MKTAIIDKVLTKLDSIDRRDLERHFIELAKIQHDVLGVLDTIPEGVVIIDPHTRITYINIAARTIFSISDSEEKRWTLRSVLLDKALSSLIGEAVERRENIVDQEVRILLPRPLVLNVSLMSIRDNPEANGFVLILRDLTYSKETERDQRDREKLRSIMTLVQGIAHEIGNPLNSIVIQLKLLQKEMGTLTASKRTRVEKIVSILLEETKRLNSCVHQFLNFTRRSPLRFRKVNINRILEDVIRLTSEELRASKISYTLELNSEIPSFLADGEQLHRAFLNIVKNALEAMPSGGSFRVRTERAGKLVKIAFRDQGVGIAEGNRQRIFDLYFSTKANGSGLGLAIVKSIIDEHGGRIEVESKVGQGSVFTVILPIRQHRLELPIALEKGIER